MRSRIGAEGLSTKEVVMQGHHVINDSTRYEAVCNCGKLWVGDAEWIGSQIADHIAEKLAGEGMTIVIDEK